MAGEEIANDDDGIDHDGIELTINRTDLDNDFPDTETNCESNAVVEDEDEPGQLSSSEDEEVVIALESPARKHRHSVASKVMKVNNYDRSSRDNDCDKRFQKFQHLKDDPDFRCFLSEIVDDEIATTSHNRINKSNGKESGEPSSRKQGLSAVMLAQDRVSNVNNQHVSKVESGEQLVENSLLTQPNVRSGNNIEGVGIECDGTPTGKTPVCNLIKSPSDTTLYTPGLRKADDSDLIDKISDFVESMCLDAKKKNFEASLRGDTRRILYTNNRHEPGGSGAAPSSSRKQESATFNPDMIDTESASDHLLVQAEKFKAQIEAPKGNQNYHDYTDMLMPYDYEKLRDRLVTPEGLAPIDKEILFLRNFDQDDEFFHVTSQIDQSTRSKIEHGEFLDLERLLPKERPGSRTSTADELNKHLFQLITQGSNTFVDPPTPKVGKISSVRKWDQAFHVYAAIYTQANPSRASEIWQYVYVIHTAASANPWDNVYFYDINFRQLMASKPWRSWGKTYTQGWNMAFNNANSNFMSASPSTAGNSNSMSSYHNKGNNSKSWKDDCCWRFNKNKCKRSNSECNYDHRCTYCAGWNHGFLNCRKRQSKQQLYNKGKGTGKPVNTSINSDKKE